jgi:hypothetical protein
MSTPVWSAQTHATFLSGCISLFTQGASIDIVNVIDT